MTLTTAIKITANRVGLLETNVSFKDRARDYLNIAAKRIGTRAKWNWLHKTTSFNTTQSMTVSGISSTFRAGEGLEEFGSPEAEATMDTSYDDTNAPTTFLMTGENDTAFTADGTVVGAESGATATITAAAADTQTYQLAADVLTPHSFTDQSNNQPLGIVGWEAFDQADPDRGETGDVDVVTIEGVDAVTGRILVRLYPIHSTSGDVIRYRYLAYIPDWTSSDDSTELDRWIPEWLQPALIFGATELYKQEKGDYEGALTDRAEYETGIKSALDINLNVQGNREWHRGRGGPVSSFWPQEGGLTAAG